jgi:hypothetical protein
MNTYTEHFVHILAGLAIVAGPMLLAGIPVSWQAETVGGIIAFALSLIKSYYGTSA